MRKLCGFESGTGIYKHRPNCNQRHPALGHKQRVMIKGPLGDMPLGPPRIVPHADPVKRDDQVGSYRRRMKVQLKSAFIPHRGAGVMPEKIAASKAIAAARDGLVQDPCGFYRIKRDVMPSERKTHSTYKTTASRVVQRLAAGVRRVTLRNGRTSIRRIIKR